MVDAQQMDLECMKEQQSRCSNIYTSIAMTYFINLVESIIQQLRTEFAPVKAARDPHAQGLIAQVSALGRAPFSQTPHYWRQEDRAWGSLGCRVKAEPGHSPGACGC